MAGSFLLTKHELKDLTGWEDVKRQMEWLVTHGYPFDVGGDGFPKVLRLAVIQKMLGSLGSEQAFSKAQEPNFAILGR